jgi:outer membrane protein assembly factor BamE
MLRIIVLCFIFVMSGCVYKIDIQQGNIVTQEMLSKLELGMTKQKARFVLGTALLQDMFHQDRWDYFYSVQKHLETPQQRHITLVFEKDKLVAINGEVPDDLRNKLPASSPKTEKQEPLL